MSLARVFRKAAIALRSKNVADRSVTRVSERDLEVATAKLRFAAATAAQEDALAEAKKYEDRLTDDKCSLEVVQRDLISAELDIR